MTCRECGTLLKKGTLVCVNCGARQVGSKSPIKPPVVHEPDVEVEITEVENENPAVREIENWRQENCECKVQQEEAGYMVQEDVPQVASTEDVVSVGEWLVSYLILMVPIVNFIMIFVWAFGKNTKRSKANYFKASLILSLITIVLSFALAFVLGDLLFSGLQNYYF